MAALPPIEDLQISQRSRAVEDASNHQARGLQVGRQIGVHGLWSDQIFGVGMRGRGRIRVLHNGSAQYSVDVDGVILVTDEFAVVVERASRTGAADDGDTRTFLILARRTNAR